MFPQMLLALLSDSSGLVLLVRRKDSLLWSLPGSIVRAPVASRVHFLAACCRRQVGVTPEFVMPLTDLSLGGNVIAVGTDDVLHARVRACGRVVETRWFSVDDLPVDLAPAARMAIAVLGTRGVEMDLAQSGLQTVAC